MSESESKVKRFLYISDCVHGPFDVHDLDIMREALSFNAQHGITGFLHRTNKHYFQCIEGTNLQIDRLVDKIRADTRHANLCPLMEDGIAFTQFPGWSMGYSRELGSQEGFQIDAGTAPADVLEFLIEEANRQIAEFKKKP